jgi:hypothetical protein
MKQSIRNVKIVVFIITGKMNEIQSSTSRIQPLASKDLYFCSRIVERDSIFDMITKMLYRVQKICESHTKSERLKSSVGKFKYCGTFCRTIVLYYKYRYFCMRDKK